MLRSTIASEDQLVVDAVLLQDIRAVGRLITRIESGDETVVPILQTLYRHGTNTSVIGLTGPPGVGKSTLVDQMIAYYRSLGRRIAVLAVDPASPFSGGAILGDRVRMARHNVDKDIFIRSMSARGKLGGMAVAAADALTIIDAMGIDLILLETVGVGQNEIDIMNYADTVIVIQSPVAGDGIQAVKAGVLEIADIFVMNKADMPGAHRAALDLQKAIDGRMDPHQPDRWCPPVVLTQATDNTGLADLTAAINRHLDHLRIPGEHSTEKRKRQAAARVLELVSKGLRQRWDQQTVGQGDFEQFIDGIVSRETDPHAVANGLLKAIV